MRPNAVGGGILPRLAGERQGKRSAKRLPLGWLHVRPPRDRHARAKSGWETVPTGPHCVAGGNVVGCLSPRPACLMLRFLLNNLRWLAAGFLLTFASACGQTWFISLSATAIKQEYGLSNRS